MYSRLAILVVRRRIADPPRVQLGTEPTMAFKPVASFTVMTAAGKWAHVMERPNCGRVQLPEKTGCIDELCHPVEMCDTSGGKLARQFSSVDGSSVAERVVPG